MVCRAHPEILMCVFHQAITGCRGGKLIIYDPGNDVTEGPVGMLRDFKREEFPRVDTGLQSRPDVYTAQHLQRLVRCNLMIKLEFG